MKIYEYYGEVHGFFPMMPQVDYINEMALRGWRLISVSDHKQFLMFYFERELYDTDILEVEVYPETKEKKCRECGKKFYTIFDAPRCSVCQTYKSKD